MVGLSAPELIAIGVIALLIFGPRKLPELIRRLWQRLFARIEDPHERLFEIARQRAELEADTLQHMWEARFETEESVTPAMMERRWELMRLSQRDDREAIGQLIIALGSHDEWIRWRAARAFADKAERHPQVMLRAALPILQKRVQRREETAWVRAACLTAMHKIEEATREWGDKPIPFMDFDTPTDTLPIPVDAPDVPDASQLPRPSQKE
jgi:hypothetical protein